MLSPSARESWNDQPGCGAGFSVPEIHAWANVNAFIARITQAGLAGFWMYAIWALRDALEEEHLDYDLRHKPEKAAKLLDAFIPAAAVWIIVMGRELWEKDEDLTPKSRNEGDPARGGKLWKGKSAFCKERWDLWATRFEALSKMEGLMAETREIAAEAFASMEKIKGTAIINPPLVLLGCPGYESFVRIALRMFSVVRACFNMFVYAYLHSRVRPIKPQWPQCCPISHLPVSLSVPLRQKMLMFSYTTDR